MNYQKTILCKLAYKYGSDKCPQIKHFYTPYYYKLLKDKRQKVKKVLEIGVGYSKVMQHAEQIKGSYITGASLYMWRDFFPNAQIFGIDIYPEAKVDSVRIKTFICDQTKKNDLIELIKATGGDIDLIVDDGCHDKQSQAETCLTLMQLVSKKTIYIIEDARYAEEIVERLSKYNCYIPQLGGKFRDSRLIVVTSKDESNSTIHS